MFIFKRNDKMFSKKSEDELKRDTEILVIDDKKIELIRAIEKEGWKIKYLPDLDSYSNQYLKSSHILCIDILGVGKQLKCKDGMELVKNIKTHYPNIKIILYSSTSEHDIFDEILDIVDERIHKDGQPFPFLKAIKTLSANTFDWSSCTKSTYDKFKTEFGVEISYEEFEKKMRKLVEKKKLNNEDVAKILSCGKIGIEIVSVLSKFVE